MTEDLGDDFFMYTFTMQTFLCQIFFMAWMGDKLTQTVFHEQLSILAYSFSPFYPKWM